MPRSARWILVLAAVALAMGVGILIGTRWGGERSATGAEPVPSGGLDQDAAAGPRPEIADRNLMVIGLDGADWDLIDPLIARGELPNIARLVREGTRARLRTITPILSPVVWTTVATGKGPSKHGILDFLAQAPDGSMVPVTSTLRQSKAIWNILGEGGVPVAVTAWWATWPAERVNGLMATDRIAYQLFKHLVSEGVEPEPAGDGRGKTWPEGLFDEIQPLVVEPASVTDDEIARFVDLGALGRPDADDRERLEELKTILASTRTYERIGRELLRRQPRGFHSIYNESTDTAAHLFMTFRPPRRPEVDERRARAFGGVVDAVYREADAMIGRVLEDLGDGWNVMVLSDHGFKHGDNRPTTDPRVDRGPGADWHDRFGILILCGPDVRAGDAVADATVLDIAPTVLALYGLPVGEDMDGRVLEEALEPGFLKAHPIRRIPTYESGERAPAAAEPSAQDAEMMAKLRALGYIAGPDGSAEGGDGPGSAGFSQNTARVHNNRGLVLLTQRDLEGALAEFEKALEVGGGLMALVNIAQTHILARDLEKAESALAEVERRYPDARMLPALRGAVADLGGNDAEAERYLREALRIDPADSRSRTRLGHLLEKAGKLDEALAEYQAAIRANPENAEAHNYAGNIYRVRGSLGEAERCYRKAVETDPRYAGAYNNLGLLLQESGRPDEAIGLYRKGLELAPRAALLLNSLGSLLILKGDWDEAEREIRRALESAPEMAEAHNNLGILLAQRKRTREARESFEAAVKYDPAFADARFNLAKALLLLGETEAALDSFAKASELAPKRLDAAIGAGEVAYRLGRTEEALAHFERARDLDPDSARVRRRLGDLYLARGDEERAVQEWEQSLAVEPDQPDLREQLERLEGK